MKSSLKGRVAFVIGREHAICELMSDTQIKNIHVAY